MTRGDLFLAHTRHAAGRRRGKMRGVARSIAQSWNGSRRKSPPPGIRCAFGAAEGRNRVVNPILRTQDNQHVTRFDVPVNQVQLVGTNLHSRTDEMKKRSEVPHDLAQ